MANIVSKAAASLHQRLRPDQIAIDAAVITRSGTKNAAPKTGLANAITAVASISPATPNDMAVLLAAKRSLSVKLGLRRRLTTGSPN